MTTMKTTFQQIKVSELKSSLDNPRDSMTNIEELAASVKQWGILQPLAVRKVKEGYEIIAGHRRAKAAEMAGLTTVPCVIRTDKGSVVMQQLVENTQRVDLMPYEIAAGINLAIKERKIKQKQLGIELGKSEAWVSKFVTIAKAIEKRIEKEKKLYPFDEYKADYAEEYGADDERLKADWEQYALDNAIMGDLAHTSVDTAYLAAAKIVNPEKAQAPATKTKTTTTIEQQQDLPELEEKQRLLTILVEHIKKTDMPVTGYNVTPEGKAGWKVSLVFESSKKLEQHFGK